MKMNFIYLDVGSVVGMVVHASPGTPRQTATVTLSILTDFETIQSMWMYTERTIIYFIQTLINPCCNIIKNNPHIRLFPRVILQIISRT